MAPRLIKFPDTPNKFIMATANSMASGITEATTKPALTLPSINTNTNITISAPSIRFLLTVPMALFTNLVRSKNGSITSPSGKVFSI